MKPLLYAIEADHDLRLSLIVTDQHVNELFGATISEVEREFAVAAIVDMEQTDGSKVARVQAIGRCMMKMAMVFADLKPDVVVLYGDRGEVLAAAIAAVNLGIPAAHIQGGDVSGNVDEQVRHAITKLAHLHFPSTEESAQRIRKMGEEAQRIFVVGDSHIDPIVGHKYTDEDLVRKLYQIPPGERPIVVLQHPETIRNRPSYQDMKITLDAVLSFKRRTVIVYPCSDQGYEGIIRAIEEVREVPGVSVHRNIDAPDFWGILAISSALVGNSSAGLIETPYFKIPAINVGERQKGRRCAENVIHVPFDSERIRAAMDTALNDLTFVCQVSNCSRPYGEGKAYLSILSVLKSTVIDDNLLDKRMTY